MFEFLVKSAQATEKLKINGLILNIGWWPYLFTWIKYLLIFMTIILVVGIVLILIRSIGGLKIKIKDAVEEAMEAGRLPKTKAEKRWESILHDVDSNNSQDYKKAVIDAEKMFNRILKIANFSGSNIEEKLKKVSDEELEFKEDIVWAHKLKEKIEEDENFQVEHEEAKRAVYIFERVLKELGIL